MDEGIDSFITLEFGHDQTKTSRYPLLEESKLISSYLELDKWFTIQSHLVSTISYFDVVGYFPLLISQGNHKCMDSLQFPSYSQLGQNYRSNRINYLFRSMEEQMIMRIIRIVILWGNVEYKYKKEYRYLTSISYPILLGRFPWSVDNKLLRFLIVMGFRFNSPHIGSVAQLR